MLQTATAVFREGGKAALFLGLVVSCLVLFSQSFAQTGGTISGIVTHAKTGEALPGAQIVVQGTTRGAATGPDGSYVIRTMPPGTYKLFVRFIGFYTQEAEVSVRPNEQATANFRMRESVLRMDEIVVTGTGMGLAKRELTTPIATLSAQEIQMAPVQSIDQLLQARIPGASVNLASGLPGTGGRIRTRGVTSVAGSETPAIYVDGVRVDKNDNYRLAIGSGGPVSSSLPDLIVGNIERVEFVKGGAAATLYGSDASAGVIQIFTNKGKAGAPQWTFRVDGGYNQPYEQFIIEDFTRNQVIESGYHQSYMIGLNGGSELSTYNFSGRMLKDDGNIKGLDTKTYALHGGLRVFATERLQLDFSSALVRNDFGRVLSDNAIAGIMSTSERGYFNPADEFSPYQDYTDEQKLKILGDYLSPELTEAVNRFTFSTTANYAPSPWFQNRLTIGTDYRKSEQRQFIPIQAAQIASTPGGALFRSDREYLGITLWYSGTVRYPSTGNLTSAFTFGVQGFREEDRASQATGRIFGLPGTDDFDNTSNIAAQESNQELFSGGFFFDEQIGINNRLYLNGGVRIDGNSAFGDEVGLQAYPKAAIAYNVSDEAFWRNSFLGNAWNGMKLRASWGKTGTFPNPFVKDSTFTTGSFIGVSSAGFGNPGNDEVKPEKTETFDVGFDAAFLNERVGLEFSWYKEKTTDALFVVPSQPSSGLGPQLRNIGEIQNDGIELAANATIISNRDFSFSLRASVATLDNKVTKLNGAPPFTIGGFAFIPQRVEEGEPVGVFRTTHANDNPSTTAFESDTRLDFNPFPRKTGNVSANFTLFRNLNLSLHGDWQTGGYSLNTIAVTRVFDSMKPHIDRIPPGYNFQTSSGVFVEESDYFKMREIVAQYRFRTVKYVRELLLTASVRNIYTFTGAKDFDPELHAIRSGVQNVGVDAGGITFATLSPARQFRFGAEISF
ncbi:MAG: TonB-dependent receptor domain-containing protein [bacterium]